MQALSSAFRPLAAGLACLLALPGLFRSVRAAEPAPGIIEVRVTGSGGVPVILIPGLATPASIWDDTVAALKGMATCYAVNVAGFGGMPPAAKREHFLADVRDAIIAYAREHKLDHPVIIGHSLGGDLALDIAAQAPDLPDRVVIVDSLPFLAALMDPSIKTEADARRIAPFVTTALSNAGPEQFADLQKQFISDMVASPEKAAAIAAQTGRSDPATVGQAMGELLVTDRRPALASIRCPVLVLGALADKVARGLSRKEVELAYRTQYANVSRFEFQFFPDARHFIMVDDPAGFQKAVLVEVGLSEAKRAFDH